MNKAQTLARIKSRAKTSLDPAALDRLTEEINAHYWELVSASKNGLSHAMAAGQELLKIKQRQAHGLWLTYVEEKLDFSVATAQGLIKLYKKLPAAIKAAGHEAHEIVSIRGALKLISQSSKPPKSRVINEAVLSISPSDQGVSESEIDGTATEGISAEPARPDCIHQYDEDGVCMRCRREFVPRVTEKDKPRILKDIQNGLAAMKVLLRGVGALGRLADQGSWKKKLEHDLKEIEQQYAAFMGPFV
jgi:hypothetical protein